MSYHAAPIAGHAVEEICGILEGRAEIELAKVINGIVVVITEADPPSELEQVAYIDECADHRFLPEFTQDGS